MATDLDHLTDLHITVQFQVLTPGELRIASTLFGEYTYSHALQYANEDSEDCMVWSFNSLYLEPDPLFFFVSCSLIFYLFTLLDKVEPYTIQGNPSFLKG